MVTLEKQKIPDVILIKPQIFTDDRGYFFENFKQSEFSAQGLPTVFVQDNFSFSKKGVIRGLHFQVSPYAQGKLITCLSGRIFDVAVDIRKASPTFGQWVGMELGGDNNYALYVPEGFAHGFVVLEDNTRVLYKCTKEYNHLAERGLKWNDPSLSIAWPIAEPIVNPRDAAFPLLKDAEVFA